MASASTTQARYANADAEAGAKWPTPQSEASAAAVRTARERQRRETGGPVPARYSDAGASTWRRSSQITHSGTNHRSCRPAERVVSVVAFVGSAALCLVGLVAAGTRSRLRSRPWCSGRGRADARERARGRRRRRGRDHECRRPPPCAPRDARPGRPGRGPRSRLALHRMSTAPPALARRSAGRRSTRAASTARWRSRAGRSVPRPGR